MEALPASALARFQASDVEYQLSELSQVRVVDFEKRCRRGDVSRRNVLLHQ
jgi:hypothetical protein